MTDISGAPLSEKRVQTSDTSPSIQERLRTHRISLCPRCDDSVVTEAADHLDQLEEALREFVEADLFHNISWTRTTPPELVARARALLSSQTGASPDPTSDHRVEEGR